MAPQTLNPTKTSIPQNHTNGGIHMVSAVQRNRIKKVFAEVENDGKMVDVILFVNSTEPHMDLGFFYVTGLTEGVFEDSVAVVWKNGEGTLVTSILEEETAKKSGFKLHIMESREEWKDRLKEAAGPAEVIGVNAEEITLSKYQRIKETFPNAEIVDISPYLKRARMVKDEEEIERTKRACDLASRAAELIVESIKEGVREYEIAAELTYLMQKHGASGNSFSPIAAFGPNSAEPHYLAGDREAKKGDTILLDFGCVFKRYTSDITRTFFLGKATAEQKKVYETVLHAQELGIDAIAEGVNGAEVDRKVREYIDSTEYKGRFIHSTGHSIGLSVHDGGVLNHKIDLPLRAGMIFTVEPGIYLPGNFGVRIEDDVLVTPRGHEVLTTAPKDLLEL